jgi:hypothetical protein
MRLRKLTAVLQSADVLIIGYFLLVALLTLAFASRIPSWRLLVIINVSVSAAIWILAAARSATGWKILAFVHDWYVPPVVFFYFKEL